MTPILEIDSLTKRYGRLRALNNFSLSVRPGSVYGILGPNGSGKSTILAIILGVLYADWGSYRWFGQAPSAVSRRRIGSLPEKPGFLPWLSGYQNLKISAATKEVDYSSIDNVLDQVNLTDRKRSPYRTYSLGMKQRLALAAALLGDPEVLVLDEPTNGLDPQGIFDVRGIIQEIAARGKTIILAGHILDEIEKVCTHVAVLKKGDKLAAGPTHEILAKHDRLEIAASDMTQLRRFLETTDGITGITEEHNRFIAAISREVDIAGMNAELISKGISPHHLVRKKQTLESRFMEITGSEE